MASDLGGSQISALLESVPGIANVLRSPVADAMVNMIRAGAGVGPFYKEDAEELVQYAVRRGLIGGREGDEVLALVHGKGKPKPPPPKRPKPPKKPSPFRSRAPVPAPGAARKAAPSAPVRKQKKATSRPVKKAPSRSKKR